MRLKGDTYLKAYRLYREDQIQEIKSLKNEVYELKRMVEWLCSKIIPELDE